MFLARRRVCLETPGEHEWVLSGLLPWSWIEYDASLQASFGIANKTQAVLIIAIELNFTERASQSEHQHCRAGDRGPR